MAVPMYHRRVTNAANALGKAVAEMEQAYYESKDPAYQKLADTGRKLLKRYHGAWDKSVKRGKREGWL